MIAATIASGNLLKVEMAFVIKELIDGSFIENYLSFGHKTKLVSTH